ncbi:MAG: dephospho-CoA kinase, partial [Bacteroidota bacterium]
MAIRVGITGGMGSGKSTVVAIFETLGIPVYRADDAAKRIMNEDETVKKEIKKHFGEPAYSDKGLHRQYLAAEVFDNN